MILTLENKSRKTVKNRLKKEHSICNLLLKEQEQDLKHRKRLIPMVVCFWRKTRVKKVYAFFHWTGWTKIISFIQFKLFTTTKNKLHGRI